MALFPQGTDVDRNRPHWLHRDYWILRVILEETGRFSSRVGEEGRPVRVLDFGAGDSPYADAFRSKGAEFLRADLGSVEPGVLSIASDGRVPLEDGTVDYLISTQVLEHVLDPQAYLKEALRLLRPGGEMFLSTHGSFLLHPHPIDLRRWTIDGLEHELRLAGFGDVSVHPRIGVLAAATHSRSIVVGGALRRSIATRWLRGPWYLLANLRMMIEDKITPASIMSANPEILVSISRKPA